MARLDDARRARIVEALHRGGSNRGIARELGGVSYETVAKVRREIGVAPLSAGGRHGLIVQASLPFQGQPSGRPNIPPPDYALDQTPPPRTFRYDPRYHGHTFKASAPPQAFDGWDIDRIRNAISFHDQGFFLESSQLAITVTRFGPVFAALRQALAPALALPRLVTGGTRGLPRVVREELQEQLAPSAGLMPSPYFPPSLWGAMQLELRTMGFAVLQHVVADEPDPRTGVQPVYTRRWPTWAVQHQTYRRTYQALTTDGPVDIVNGDGKFTILGDTDQPHYEGAIRALALEVMDGTLIKQARASYIDRYGNPKWVGTMPEAVATNSPQGDDFMAALSTLQGPDGIGVLPFGATYKAEGLTAEASSVFVDSLDNVWQYVAAIILGSDGTLSKGTGVYTAPMFAGVARHLVAATLAAMVRGVNLGHVATYEAINYAATIDATPGWVHPALDIPLPDPEADARIKSHGDRRLRLCEVVEAERKAGFVVDQARVNELAVQLDVSAPTLAEVTTGAVPLDIAPTDLVKEITPNEIRASRQLPQRPGERNDKTIREIEEEAAAAQAQAEADAQASADDAAGESDAAE